MKTAIHPLYTDQTVQCVCGAVYEVGSTKQNLRIEICSNCHPFFTGNEKILDAAGRVEKFKVRSSKKTAPAKKSK